MISKGVDVEAEVEIARQLRKQIRLGPQASAPSVAMYTFFHTHDGMNCLDFNHQQNRVAAGFAESYIRIWDLSAERRARANPNEEIDSSAIGASPRMIGHSAPVYSISWTPTPAKSPAFLLSSSGDKTIRLWSADTYKALVVYKGHSQPVWDVKWGPNGQYFVSGSGDATGRIWSVEHINPMRILAGHIGDVEVRSRSTANVVCKLASQFGLRGYR
jgi:transcription initiation factor TFIID subunit 5